MSERKVLTKYYPPDWDPSLLGRSRGPKQVGPKVQTVRLMAPFSLRCTACGEYMYRGRKFNARKETPVDERYLSVQIYRFYIRCTRCSAEIVFRTDPRNQNYIVEKGAKRNTEPWRRGLEGELEESDEARLDRIEREMAANADDGSNKGYGMLGLGSNSGSGGAGGGSVEERNAMAELEAKTADAKREMAVADALDEIRSRNARIEKAHRDGVEVEVVVPVAPEEEERRRQEQEDAEAARRAFAFQRSHEMLEEDVEVEGAGWVGSSSTAEAGPSSGPDSWRLASIAETKPAPITKPAPVISTDMPPPSFKRQVKKKKDHSALLGIKKKQPLV
ncbi:CWC16 protein [Lasiosphaeria hispida]|uniref:Splicing factor YJU2 n=1 Tax=Lasiosphaeria hispida TaxID=260671 RepID=A0AAJ0HR45_9PEZI|nr:CWC16 protein [Lasiosphaeria hispida]